ncbi:Uncharacterised protein [Mycobacteroides abscessus subsp. massiliense]|nr:Uncharacterised protein [Mycobacteroides abscessus subsp. massiliense]
MFRSQHGAQQGLVGAGAGKHVGIGHDLLDLIALQGVSFQTFDRVAGKEPVYLVDPLHGANERLSVASGAFT